MTITGLVSVEYIELDGIAYFDIYHTQDGLTKVMMNLHPQFSWKRLSERPTEKRRLEIKPIINHLQKNCCENKVLDIVSVSELSIVSANKMLQQEFLLCVEDCNGTKYLFGEPETPVKFKYDYSSAQAALDIEWYGKTRFPPFLIL
jgi:hypothetical protein